jgi:hypothetical protein
MISLLVAKFKKCHKDSKTLRLPVASSLRVFWRGVALRKIIETASLCLPVASSLRHKAIIIKVCHWDGQWSVRADLQDCRLAQKIKDNKGSDPLTGQ